MNDAEKAAKDENAQRLQRIEQATGEAREIAALAAAFHLEALRNGVATSDATALTAAYIGHQLTTRFMRDYTQERDRKGPWA